MPIEVTLNGEKMKLDATFYWKKMQLNEPLQSLEVDVDYYVGKMSHGTYELE